MLAGKQLMPRDIAAHSWAHWRNYELTKATAVALAESGGYLGAWHDNTDDNGAVVSRDLGLYQINQPASVIGTPAEFQLRTDSTDPDVYTPVWDNNTGHAWSLYNQSWVRGGGPDIRRWQPWVAYTTGWATFPEWWVWHQDVNGVPVGPWIATGRYIQKAIAGQINAHIVIFQDWSPTTALMYARRYADHFGIKDTLYLNSRGLITWQVPPRPSGEPKDGVGPRPVPNDGL